MNWQYVCEHLNTVVSKTGRTYHVIRTDAKRITLGRPDTGSTVVVTRRKCEQTLSRLKSGPIPRRKIDYTVAVETGIVAALCCAGFQVVDDGKQYSLR